jgi:hypothetical protein
VFLEFVDLLKQEEKKELFKQYYNRCYPAVTQSYEYEKEKFRSFWRFDERYHVKELKSCMSVSHTQWR